MSKFTQVLDFNNFIQLRKAQPIMTEQNEQAPESQSEPAEVLGGPADKPAVKKKAPRKSAKRKGKTSKKAAPEVSLEGVDSAFLKRADALRAEYDKEGRKTENLALKVKELNDDGLTQAVLAQKLGLSTASISNWISGAKKGKAGKTSGKGKAQADPAPMPAGFKRQTKGGQITVTFNGNEITGTPEALKALLGV